MVRTPTVLRGLVTATLALLAVGCAGDLDIPDPPAGDACTTYEDCAPAGEVACGPVRACVDRVCEASPSLYIVCR